MSLKKLMIGVLVFVVAALALPAVAIGKEMVQNAQTPSTTTAVAATDTVRWGPFTIPASVEGGEHAELPNQVMLNVKKPCSGCFITGIQSNLEYADGTSANVNTGPMLHHMVLFKQLGSTDLTCGMPTQRIFASGNERTHSTFPAGYGMKVDLFDRWTLLYDLMNHAYEEKQVYITLKVTHQPSFLSPLKKLTPIWMDADGCGNSEWDAPEGHSEKSWQWTSTISGTLMHMRGHVHHSGTLVRTDNVTSGNLLCESVAEEGGTPEFIDMHGNTEVSDMPVCQGPLGAIRKGDVLKVTAEYDINGHSHHGVMGIMVGFVAEN